MLASLLGWLAALHAATMSDTWLRQHDVEWSKRANDSG
jgi:hypothetical protein